LLNTVTSESDTGRNFYRIRVGFNTDHTVELGSMAAHDRQSKNKDRLLSPIQC
jgi:hypothetical protein